MTECQMKQIILTVLLVSSVQSLPRSSTEPCECSIFLQNERWLPRYLVMAMTNEVQVDCGDGRAATEACKTYCSDEMAALKSLYERDPSILDGYPPSQSLPCDALPRATVSFSRACGRGPLVLSSRETGPAVCCHAANSKPSWCDGFDLEDNARVETNNVFQGRKLDLQKNQNDESHNEIEDSSDSSSSASYSSPSSPSPSSSSYPAITSSSYYPSLSSFAAMFETKPGKNKFSIPFIPPGTESWIQTSLKLFGYDSLTDVVKSIDIFSIPGKVKSAIRTYKDEVSMGRCYMEFTTFKVFTKQENPFEGLLRKKRDVPAHIGPVTRFDEFVDYDYEMDDLRSHSGNKKSSSRTDSIMKLLGRFVGMLEGSTGTNQYANILNTVLPLISQMMSGGGATGGSGATSPMAMVLKFVGPLISQMGSSKPNYKTKELDYTKPPTKKPTRPTQPAPSSPSTSPIASMIMTMLGNVITNFFNTPGSQKRIERPTHITTIPTKPSSTVPPSFDFASSGIMSLLKLLMQSASAPANVARPIETPKPEVKEPVTKKPETIESKAKNFIDVLLEVIRPVFISIVGNAPGENGVKEIRKVSTLSTLGRVDDTLREEVDSPFFCFKKYMVNKAWSVTENGIRTVISKFTPEEQERMMERMLA